MSEIDVVSRRFAHREGGELVAVRPVALPVFKVVTRVQVEERLPLPVMHEYSLRAIKEGFSDPESVAGVLGLESDVLNLVLVDLLRSDDLVVTSVAGSRGHTLQITPRGRQTLAEAETVAPREEVVSFSVDGLTRDIDIWNLPDAIRSSDVRRLGLLELPAHPRRPPELLDLDIGRLRELVDGGQARRLRLLEVLEIAQRHRLFRTDAFLLVYRPPNGEPEVEVVVDSSLSSGHSEAYRRAESRSRRRLVEIDLSSTPIDLARESLGEDVSTAAERFERQARALRAERDQTTDRRLTLSQRLNVLPPDVSADELRTEAEALAEEAGAIESSLSELPVRFLDVHEHRPLFLSALREANELLIILSPWIRSDATNDEVINAINDAASRGVRIIIGYGLGSRRDDDEQRTVTRLKRVVEKHSNCKLIELGDIHAKVLIADDRIGVTTSFNWLSFRGDPDRTFRDERGTLVTHPALVNELFNHVAPRLGLAPVAIEPGERQLALIATPRFAPTEILEMIAQGEGPYLEFKSSARWNYNAGQAGKEIEDAVVRTVAGFMNSQGGTLLIGVDDNGERLGLERDIAVSGNRGLDGFRNWLGMKLADALGKVATSALSVTVVVVEGEHVCAVEVPPAHEPVWAKTSKGESFFVRVDNSTKEFSAREAVEFIQMRQSDDR